MSHFVLKKGGWVALTFVLLWIAMPVRPQVAQSFSGHAAAVQATVLGASATLASTGSIASSGDALEASALTGSAPGLQAENMHAAVVGLVDTGSEASLGDLNVSLGGIGAVPLAVSADFVMGQAAAVCSSGVVSLSGSSQLSNLAINGQPVAVSGDPNQAILVPGGQVILNEQAQGPGNLTVNALHIVVNGVADVVVGSANAGMTCGS